MAIEGGCGFDVCGLKYVSHSHNFIYFEVPKTGATSLLNIFTEHASITKLDGRYEFLDYPDYVRCAIVRNPWDRILSCYSNKIKKDKSFENRNFENGVMRKFNKYNVFYAGMPFDEFLGAVGDIPDEIADGHFASQYRRLVMNGELIIDYLGRFENFEAEVENFLKMVGIDGDVKLPHLNRSGSEMRYRDRYDDETKSIVEKRYKEDIELFGYEF